MTPELTYLMATAILTGLLWIPSVLGQIKGRGLLQQEDYVNLPTGELPAWAVRATRAHGNAVENFSAFAAVVIVAHLIGVWPGSLAPVIGAKVAYAGHVTITSGGQGSDLTDDRPTMAR